VTTVTAHRASDGGVLWTAHVDGMPHVFAVATGHAIYLAVETGDIQCQAPAHQTEVFNPTADTLVALGSADGGVLGKQTVTAPLFFTSLQVDGNNLYAAAIPEAPTAGTVYAFDASAGTTLWHHDIDQLGYWLVVAQGAVYIEGAGGSAPGSAPATLYALRAGDGSSRWSTQQVGSGDLLPPAVGG
jgi:outer membrane protein assembly factor BamB